MPSEAERNTQSAAERNTSEAEPDASDGEGQLVMGRWNVAMGTPRIGTLDGHVGAMPSPRTSYRRYRRLRGHCTVPLPLYGRAAAVVYPDARGVQLDLPRRVSNSPRSRSSPHREAIIAAR